ncbi:DNA-protecting protein DprA [Candidatus Peregrinibacteria bacterium]|nr:DNA-protecting protein DprA [Candidatus Peregrinibacteria bacterium]
MHDSLLFWSYLDILNYSRFEKIKAIFGDLDRARSKFSVAFLKDLGCREDGIAYALQRAEDFQSVDFKKAFRALGIRLLFIEDEGYPVCLREIPDPPVFLFVRGELGTLHKAFAVVGTRRMSAYGQFVTEQLISGLLQTGFTIVSGLAIGVDACAHRVVLENGGRTIAVLGSGVDLIYPRQNESLALEILKKGGAILSEYPLGVIPDAFRFPRRNRIISGLSRGVLVAEGGVESGALITARYALEQGRDVFAVPGNIQQPGMAGTNHLIRRGEAKLVEKAEDILEEYQMTLFQGARPTVVFTDPEKRVLDELGRGCKTIDELSVVLSWNVSRLSEILVGLQLKNSIREVGREWMVL